MKRPLYEIGDAKINPHKVSYVGDMHGMDANRNYFNCIVDGQNVVVTIHAPKEYVNPDSCGKMSVSWLKECRRDYEIFVSKIP